MMSAGVALGCPMRPRGPRHPASQSPRGSCLAPARLAHDGVVYRHDYQEMPPRVEYGLTDLGREMLPIVDALATFGNYYKSVVAR